MLARFLVKRTVILACVFAAAALLIGKLGAPAALGVVIGACVALYRIRLFGRFLWIVFNDLKPGRKSLIYQIFSQLSLFAVLAAAAAADLRLLVGVAAGLLTVPLAICVNAFTEKLGLTRNNWGNEDVPPALK